MILKDQLGCVEILCTVWSFHESNRNKFLADDINIGGPVSKKGQLPYNLYEKLAGISIYVSGI